MFFFLSNVYSGFKPVFPCLKLLICAFLLKTLYVFCLLLIGHTEYLPLLEVPNMNCVLSEHLVILKHVLKYE
jgi:hypothetical protein